MKVKFMLFLLPVFLFICNLKGVYAYEFPSDSFYIHVYDQSLGSIKIYVPADKVEFLAIQEDLSIINISSSNITTYTHYNGQELSITFQPFTTARYRLSNTSNYSYLNITNIESTNIDFLEDGEMFMLNANQVQVMHFTIGIMGVFALWLILFKK